MEERILMLFLRVRESFDDVKGKVSLIKPYFDLLVFSTGWALKIEEFEKLLDSYVSTLRIYLSHY